MVGVRNARGVMLSVVMASGCGSEPSAEAVRASEEVTGYATIEGTVRVEEGVQVIRNADVQPTVNQPAPPRACGRADGEPTTSWSQQVVVGAGAFPVDAAKETPAKTHEVEIESCRLGERVLPVTVGDRIKVVNKDNYPFMPTFGGDEPDAILLQDEAQTFTVTEPGMHEVHCAFTAPCAKTTVAAFFHPLHTQVDENGRFRITGVPAGVDVQIRAWHPTLAVAEQTVRLEPGENRKLDLVMKPGAPDGPMVASSAKRSDAHPFVAN